MKSFFCCIFLALWLSIPISFASQSEGQLKVMSYNVLNGFDSGNDTERKQAAAEFILSEKPDVVAFQELNGFTETSLLEFAEKWGHEYVALLKEDGHPVGLTSKKPIEVKAKITEELWHGMLHVSTHDVDFFVVHLSPSDYEFRLREAGIITKYMDEVLPKEGGKYIVLGDFNAHSPLDAFVIQEKRPMVLDFYLRSPHNNFVDNQYFDYSVISSFLAYPLIDICEREMKAEDRFSYPSPILIGTWRGPDEIVPTRIRIDYILTSLELAKFVTRTTIINSGMVDKLSDHYPVTAEFEF